MKNLKYKTSMITALMLIIVIIFPRGTEASAKNRAAKLADELDLFVFYNIQTYFMAEQYAERKKYTVKLDKKYGDCYGFFYLE